MGTSTRAAPGTPAASPGRRARRRGIGSPASAAACLLGTTSRSTTRRTLGSCFGLAERKYGRRATNGLKARRRRRRRPTLGSRPAWPYLSVGATLLNGSPNGKLGAREGSPMPRALPLPRGCVQRLAPVRAVRDRPARTLSTASVHAVSNAAPRVRAAASLPAELAQRVSSASQGCQRACG